MITKLGLYSAQISTPAYLHDGSVDVDIDDTYWSQPFLFKSDSDAVTGISKAVEGAERDVKLHAIYRVGMFDPFSGKISDIKRKEVYTYETSVNETQ